MKSYIPVLGSVPKPAEIVCGCGVVLSKADRNEFGGIGEPSVKVIVPERSAVDMVGAERFAVVGPLTTTGARVEVRDVKNRAGVSTSWLKSAVNVPVRRVAPGLHLAWQWQWWQLPWQLRSRQPCRLAGVAVTAEEDE